MSKKRKNGTSDKTKMQVGVPQRQASALGNARMQDIQQIQQEARALLMEGAPVPAGHEPRPDGFDLDKIWEMAREARDIFYSQTHRLEEARARAEEARQHNERRAVELDAYKAALEHRERQVAAREAEVTNRKEGLDAREKDLLAREAAFAAREIELEQRRLNAEAGFVAERRAALEALERSAAALRDEIAKTERDIAEQRATWLAEQNERRRQLDEQLQAALEARQLEVERKLREREEQAAKREEDARRRQQDLEQLRRKLEYERQDLQELKESLALRVEQRSAAVREELEHRISSLESQLQQARKDRDMQEARLRAREEADRRFGQRTPDEVLGELDSLRAERDALRKELAERLDAGAAGRLCQLEAEREAWQSERLELQRRLAEMERRLSYANVAATQLETLRDEKVALETSRSALHQAIEELKADVDTLICRADARRPFPACTAMDEDAELQARGAAVNGHGIGDLAAFVEDLRHRMAFDPEHPDRALYYALEDVRSFLAGLAMGPLVLLQGISGTGKTSLPLAFARAMGTRATVIEVQAGWRDPQDLVGHYNAFERRFYEKECLQALYRAQTPRWADTVQIILLDEMNLSHPEQYFSDMLSALERNPEERRLVLVPHAMENAPTLFDEGHKLRIPENVWFVGTANHDETTKNFADKTYDRAHVMELPLRPQPFEIQKLQPRSPVSFRALCNAFNNAMKSHQKEANRVIQFLETHIRDPLMRCFEIGWGPRLERQLRRYVPVVIAAGGTDGEAADHMLAMRLLRKLKNRHDNRPQDLDAFRKQLEAAWMELDAQREPRRSMDVLRSELRRLGWAPGDRA